VVVNGPAIFNYESTSNITSSQSNTTINITSIIDTVNSSSHSPEEKEMIKQILEYFQKEVTTKLLPGVVDNIKAKFKDWFPLASPFIQQGIGLLFQACLNLTAKKYEWTSNTRAVKERGFG
jgi:hypothetical protein